MAFKDWGFFPYVAALLATNGYPTISFNFSGNGVAGDGNRITDFSGFAANTFGRELADLDTLLTAVADGRIGPKTGISSLVLLGHSRGAGIALLTASRDARVGGLITWAAIASFDRWTRHQKEKWREQGYLALARDSTVSPLRLGLNLLDELELHAEEYSLISAAARLRVPWLLLHGKADVTVSPREAEALYGAAHKEQTEFALIDHAGHLFNAASREEDNYNMLHTITDRTIHWLNTNF
jgi:pimeloyl-ACP methyl ester carboxylesterase